jgi:hypothetical protein
LGLPLFSLEVFCFEPLAFWGYLFFHQRSFVLCPLHFGVTAFSSEVFCFEPVNESCNNAPLFAALAYMVQHPFLLNMELASLVISMMVLNALGGGDKAYIIASGLHGFHLVKNLTPS